MRASTAGAGRVAPPAWLVREAAEPFWTTVALAAGGAAAAALNLVLARTLGPAEYGLVSNVQAVALFALGFATLGAADAVPRTVEAGGDAGAVPWVGIFGGVCLRAVLPVAVVVALAAGVWYGWPPGVVLGAAVLLAGIGTATLAGNIVRTAASPAAGQWLIQAWRLASLPVVAAVALLPGRLTAAWTVWAFVAAGLLGAAPGVAAVLRLGGGRAVSGGLRATLRAESWSFLGINASLALLNYLDHLVVPAVLGLEALGRYAVAWWLVGMPFLLFQAGTGFSLLPRLRRAGDVRGARRTLASQSLLLLGASMAAAVAAYAFAPALMGSVYGAAFSVSDGLIAAMVLCSVLRVLYVVPSSVVGAWGEGRALVCLNRWGWPAAGCAAFFAWLGATTWGLTGVALGVAIGLALRLAVAAALARRSWRGRMKELRNPSGERSCD